MNRLSNSASPIVTGGVTPSAVDDLRHACWSARRPVPRRSAALSLFDQRRGLIGGNRRDRQVLRLCRRRRGLLRPLEFGREYRGQLRVLQHRRQRLAARARPAADSSGSAAIPPAPAVGPLGMANQEDRGLRARPRSAAPPASVRQGCARFSICRGLSSRVSPGAGRRAFRTAIRYSTAPATIAAATVASWVDVAPARIVTPIRIAAIGIDRPERHDERRRLDRRCEARDRGAAAWRRRSRRRRAAG